MAFSLVFVNSEKKRRIDKTTVTRMTRLSRRRQFGRIGSFHRRQKKRAVHDVRRKETDARLRFIIIEEVVVSANITGLLRARFLAFISVDNRAMNHLARRFVDGVDNIGV